MLIYFFKEWYSPKWSGGSRKHGLDEVPTNVMKDKHIMEKGKKKVQEGEYRLNVKNKGVVIGEEKKGNLKRVGRCGGDVGSSDKLKGKTIGSSSLTVVQRDGCEYIYISSDSERCLLFP